MRLARPGVKPALAVALLVSCAPNPRPPSPAPLTVAATEQTSGTDQLLVGISVVSERVVWVGGAGGTWLRTTDGGATWHGGRVPGADTLQFRDVFGLDSTTAWLLSIGTGSASRVYVTGDGGRTWSRQLTNPDPAGFYDCFDFWPPGRGILVGDAVDGRFVVLTTTTGGDAWRRVPPERLPAALPGEGSFAASGTCAIATPGGGAWIAAGTPRSLLLHTTDYGASWSVDSIPIAGITSVSFRDARHGVVVGFDSTAAAAATHDGGRTWTRGGPPPFAAGVYGATWVPGARRPTVVAVGPGGAAYSLDEGGSWIAVDANAHWSVAFASPRAGWMVGPHGRITRLEGF